MSNSKKVVHLKTHNAIRNGKPRWLVGRSVGRSVGWSVGRSVGRLVGWSVGRWVIFKFFVSSETITSLIVR